MPEAGKAGNILLFFEIHIPYNKIVYFRNFMDSYNSNFIISQHYETEFHIQK